MKMATMEKYSYLIVEARCLAIKDRSMGMDRSVSLHMFQKNAGNQKTKKNKNKSSTENRLVIDTVYYMTSSV